MSAAEVHTGQTVNKSSTERAPWTRMHPLLVPLARLWGRYELPMWRSMLWRVSGWGWIEGLPQKSIRGKIHGYSLNLELSDWSDRFAYFLGRYYEDHTQKLMLHALKSGDRFIDIGANVGFVSMLAAWCVKADGKVIAFEPNPVVMKRLREHVEQNNLGQVITLHSFGLGDTDAELTLRLPGRFTGQATMAPLDESEGPASAEYKVPVRVGDEVFANLDASRPTFVKIDVEGFECTVLDGMQKTLARLQPAVFTEITESLLLRAGKSPDDVFNRMHELGYEGYGLDYTPGLIGFSGSLKLWRMPRFTKGPNDDVVWLLPDGEHIKRLRQFIVST
jgi:FkbM family methyltransferase